MATKVKRNLAWGDAINAEIAEIKKLHPSPPEALYRWIDQTLGIAKDGLGGALAGIDALPVYMDVDEGHLGDLYCTAIPLVPRMCHNMKFKELPVLCGMAKYSTITQQFIEAIPLESIPRNMRVKLKKDIEVAFHDTSSLRDEEQRERQGI